MINIGKESSTYVDGYPFVPAFEAFAYFMNIESIILYLFKAKYFIEFVFSNIEILVNLLTNNNIPYHGLRKNPFSENYANISSLMRIIMVQSNVISV